MIALLGYAPIIGWFSGICQMEPNKTKKEEGKQHTTNTKPMVNPLINLLQKRIQLWFK
jgi:hypothetical protein